MTEINQKLIDAFKARKKSNYDKQIDNSSLHAGSCMYYYCRKCGEMTDCRSELDFGGGPICRICSECKYLEEAGYFNSKS